MKSQLTCHWSRTQFTIKRYEVTVPVTGHCGCKVGQLEDTFILLEKSEKYATVIGLGKLKNVPNSGIVYYHANF